MYKTSRWENAKRKVALEFDSQHTFKPDLKEPPPPRSGDRVVVDLSHFDRSNKLQSSLHVPETRTTLLEGRVLAVHRDGTFDVRTADGNQHNRITPSSVRKTKDLHLSSEGIAPMGTNPQLEHELELPVHERLFALHKTGPDPAKSLQYRRQDPRSTEQKHLDEACTFKPSIPGSSPFISERTLRKLAQDREIALQTAAAMGQRSRPRSASRTRMRTSSRRYDSSLGREQVRGRSGSPLHSRSQDFDYAFDPPLHSHQQQQQEQLRGGDGTGAVSSSTDPVSMGGLYLPGHGLIRCPPSAPGIPLFFYDPAAPPSFESGTCSGGGVAFVGGSTASGGGGGVSEVVEEVEEEYSEEEDVVVEDPVVAKAKIQPEAPPLPDWAFGPGGDPSRVGGSASAGTATKPVSKIVITKRAPQEKKEEAPGG